MNYFVSLYAKSNQGTMKKLLIMALTLSMTACSMIQSDDDKATEIAVQWGEAYFNCDFHAAEKLSTPESLRWLQFAASNTTQEDLDLLKQQAADVEATDYIPEANDTLRVVELRVDHYLSRICLLVFLNRWKRLYSTSPPSNATVAGRLEWQAYREVKSKVATKFRMEYREVSVTIIISRINRLHTHIETHNEVVEVQSDAQAIACC